VEFPQYNPRLDSPALADDELDALDALLAALPEAMNIEQLDGYLTALLVAPVPLPELPGRHWLPMVWGGGDGDDPAPFESNKQRKRLIVQVLRHVRAIDVQLRHDPDRWEPIFSVAERGDGEEVIDAQDWCAGFLTAVDLDREAWAARFDDPQTGPLLVPIGVLGGDESELSPEQAAERNDPMQVDALSRSVLDAVLALAAPAQH